MVRFGMLLLCQEYCNTKLLCWLLWHSVLLYAFSSHPLLPKNHRVRKCVRWFFDPVFISTDLEVAAC
jgi:hypothetical protein